MLVASLLRLLHANGFDCLRNEPRAILGSCEIMNGHRDWGSSEEHQPVTWLRGYPLYAAHFIVLLFVVAMLATTLTMAIPAARGVPGWLTFNSIQVLQGQVWRIFTYGLVNPPSLWFVIDMFRSCTRPELEKFSDAHVPDALRSLYSHAAAVTVLFNQAHESHGRIRRVRALHRICHAVSNVTRLFNILAKWVAIVLVGIFSMMRLAANDWAA